ncbi:MAG: CPBP family intramembrane metalloprotease [Lachnospiraceae bacterium]|nr:CPBP family intramembrane metalloprotease [Lachnospiraceae bacterium]
MSQKRKTVMIMTILFVFARIMVYIEGCLVYKMNNVFGVRIPVRVLLSIVMLSCVYKYMDKDVFAWSWKKCGYAITRLSPVILLNSILVVIVIVGSILIEHRMITFTEARFFEMLGAIIMSLSISLYEEGLYRGIITGGLQKILTQNKRSVWIIVLLSGAVFGFVHIVSYFEIIKYHPGIVFIQMIITFLQYGSLGILFAAVYVRTRNIWGGIVAHFLIDVIPFLMQIIMTDSSVSVTSGKISEANNQVNIHMTQRTMVITMIIVAFYVVIHFLITWRIIKNMYKGSEEATKKEIIE